MKTEAVKKTWAQTKLRFFVAGLLCILAVPAMAGTGAGSEFVESSSESAAMQASLRDTASARTGSWKTLGFWKQQPHRVAIGTGFDVETKDAYRNGNGPLYFTLEYAYDIPWKLEALNFFVGGRLHGGWQGKKDSYYDMDLGVAAGVGLKFHMTWFLSLSAAYWGGYAYTENRWDVHGVGMEIPADKESVYRSVVDLRLTGTIKFMEVWAGYEWLWSGKELSNAYLTIGVGYRF